MNKFDVERRPQDKKELARLIKNFNAKINRIQKAHPEINYLPEKFKMREVKNSFHTRKDFNNFKKSAERFMRSGSEKLRHFETGIDMTQWEYREYAIKVSTINRKRTRHERRVNERQYRAGGKEVGSKRGETMNVKKQIYRKKKANFNKIRPGKEFEKFKESVEKQYHSDYEIEKYAQYKENYIQRLKDTFFEGKYQETLDALLNKLNNMSAKDIYDTAFFDAEMSIKFTYDPLAKDLLFDSIIIAWAEPGEEPPEFYEGAGGYEPEDMKESEYGYDDLETFIKSSDKLEMNAVKRARKTELGRKDTMNKDKKEKRK